MRKLISNKLIPISFSVAVLVPFLKKLVVNKVHLLNINISGIFEFSDVTIVFTGAFFVISLILAGTLTDYKESEKLPSEIASNSESIEDWILLGLKAPRIESPNINAEAFNLGYLKNTLLDTSYKIVEWINSTEKDSNLIFPYIRSLNEIAYYFSKRGADKEAVKGIQENTNQLRNNLTRIYSISRTEFITPAYTLAKMILVFIISLLLMAKFKNEAGDIAITFSLSFIFIYLYFLIKSLDDPFKNSSNTKIDIKPILRFINRVNSSFN